MLSETAWAAGEAPTGLSGISKITDFAIYADYMYLA
jgi:hypothetical protein